MPTPAESALTRTYGNTGTRLRTQVIRSLVALWRSLDGYRDADAARFAPAAASLVLGGQRTTSSMMVAQLAAQRSIVLGRPVRTPSVPLARVAGAAARRGTDPAVVYRRPIVEVWRQLGAGVDYPGAVELGEQRLIKTAEADLQATKVLTAQAVIADDDQAVAYRRVLVGAENCGLCVIASTQLYSKRELLPVHPGCDCSVSALYDLGDFDQDELLRQAHDAVKREFGQAAADGRAIDYRKLILTREHGERGPQLVVASHRFTGENAVKRRTSSDRPADQLATARAQLASYETSIPRLLQRQAAGENVDAPLKFQRARVAALRQQLT